MKHIFLVVLLAHPFLIKAMDEPGYIIPESIATHREDVLSLCTATYSMLQKFREKNISIKCTKGLVDVENKMDALRRAKPPVTPKQVGFFIYNTKPNEFTKIFDQRADHIFAAVFFGRLNQYYQDIASKQHVSPNAQQINNYLLKKNIEKTVMKNSNRNIMIPQKTIDEVIISAPSSVDVEQFDILMLDIKNILKDIPLDIEWAFKLIYHEELKGKANKTFTS